MNLLIQDLMRCMPTLPRARAEQLRGPLEAAMTESQIWAPLRAAAFLAQIGHESIDLTRWKEIGGERARYAPYYGRGPMQLTGKANYERYEAYSGIEVVDHPDLLLEDAAAIDSAIWFWSTNCLNTVADRLENELNRRATFDIISRRINGSGAPQVSLDARWRRWVRCYEVMATPTVVTPSA